MIEVVFTKKEGSYRGFSFFGHAEFAEEGEDIVCAAVSALVITTINSIEKFTDDLCQCQTGDGDVIFNFTDSVSKESKLLVDSLFLCISDISQEYGDEFIRIEIKEV